jgi:hypothetical protein
MFKPSEKREILETSKEVLISVDSQNKTIHKMNKKQIDSIQKKELKQELLLKEGELKKKISIKKRKTSKSFKNWFFNNNEL